MKVNIGLMLNTYGWFWEITRASDGAPLRHSVFGCKTEPEAIEEAKALIKERGWELANE